MFDKKKNFLIICRWKSGKTLALWAFKFYSDQVSILEFDEDKEELKSPNWSVIKIETK